MREIELFVNDGCGWECKRCRADDAAAAATEARGAAVDQTRPAQGETRVNARDPLPRFFREGEAEAREVPFSIRALARWLRTPRGRSLRCPRCAAEEMLADE